MSKKSRTKGLLSQVRSYLKYTDRQVIHKEEISRKFNVREHEAAQALDRLNLEGLVSKPFHYSHCWAPLKGPRRCSTYRPDTYFVRRRDS